MLNDDSRRWLAGQQNAYGTSQDDARNRGMSKAEIASWQLRILASLAAYQPIGPLPESLPVDAPEWMKDIWRSV